MKCTIPEISWHNRDPILSVDVHPLQNEIYKLASGGCDCHVLIWNLKIRENGLVDLHLVCDLNRHQRSVNVVRWSPSGTYLASGDDDASIIIWNLKTEQTLIDEETNNEECWVVYKVLRGHKEDVYDIAWSPNELNLISGSIDNTAILWNFMKGRFENILSEHKGFVQGVSWDPKGELIATISSDRTCRVFDKTGKCARRIHKGQLPVPEDHELSAKEIKYFHDDTFKSYFRRLNFTPDGNLLIVPSGCVETENYKEIKNATYIFAVEDLGHPVAFIPSPKQVTIAVRCCPIFFELQPNGPNSLVALPYRMIFAIATDSDIILYDTQQLIPFAHFRKVHYTRITDVTWSPDGLLLIASSTDGFCTLISFKPGELGTQYIKEDSDVEDVLNVSECEELSTVDITMNSKDKEQIEVKKLNILEKWAASSSKKDESEILQDVNKAQNNTNQSQKTTTEIRNFTPKRIAPIRIGNSTKGKHMKSPSTAVPQDAKDFATVSIDSSSETDNVNESENSPNKNQVKKNSISSQKNSILNFFQVRVNGDSAVNKTEPNIKNVSQSDRYRNVENKDNIEVIELDDTDSNMSTKSISDDKESAREKENVITLNSSNECPNSLLNKDNVEVQVKTVKTPRRIPFVTLASPKRKKKE